MVCTSEYANAMLLLMFFRVKMTLLFSHVAHHLLAVYALGAKGRAIEAAYRVTGSKQHSAFAAPIEITDNNFFDHLGIEA